MLCILSFVSACSGAHTGSCRQRAKSNRVFSSGISRLFGENTFVNFDRLRCRFILKGVFSVLIPLKRGVTCSAFVYDFLLCFTSLQIEVDNRSVLVPLS